MGKNIAIDDVPEGYEAVSTLPAQDTPPDGYEAVVDAPDGYEQVGTPPQDIIRSTPLPPTPMENINSMVNEGAFDLFNILNHPDYSKEFKISATNEIVKNMSKKGESFGLPPEVAKQQAEKFVNGNLTAVTGETDIARAWGKVLTSREHSLAYQGRLQDNLKALRLISQPDPQSAERPIADRVLAFAKSGVDATIPGMIAKAVGKPMLEGSDVNNAVEKYPGASLAGGLAGGAPTYAGAAMVGIDPRATFAARGLASEALTQKDREANRSLMVDKKLTPAQSAGRLATAGVLNAATGAVFQEADLAKNILTGMIKAGFGAGASTITENIVKRAISGDPQNVPEDLKNAGIQALVIAGGQGITRIPALRKEVWKAAEQVAKNKIGGKPVIKTYAEALSLLRKEGIEPEQLSAEWQQARGIQSQNERIKAAVKNINAIAEYNGWDKNIVKQVMADRNKRQLLESYYNWLYMKGKSAGIYEQAKVSYGERLAKEAVAEMKANEVALKNPRPPRVDVPQQFTDPAAPELLNHLSQYLPPKIVASLSGQERLALANGPSDRLRDFSVAMESQNKAFVENIKKGIEQEAAVTLGGAVPDQKTPQQEIAPPEGYEAVVPGIAKTALKTPQIEAPEPQGGTSAPSQAKGRVITGEEIQQFAKDNKDAILQDYEKKHGNIVSNDNMKKYFAPVGYDGTNSGSYQSEAGTITKELFNNIVERNKDTGKYVVFTTGGTGAGKSSKMQDVAQDKEVAAVWDLNLTDLEKNSKLIEETIAKGLRPKIVYVLRNPTNAFEDGVLARSLNPKSPDYNRVVKIAEHITIHNKAKETFEVLVEKFGDKLDYEIVDNRGNIGEEKTITLDELKNIKYNYSDTEKELRDYVRTKKGIPETLRKAFLSPLNEKVSTTQSPERSAIQEGRGSPQQEARNKPVKSPQTKPNQVKVKESSSTQGLAFPSDTEALKSDTWGVTMPKEAEIPETINKTEILTWVEKAFKVPIRGKATTRFQQLAGTYHNKQELIRLRNWGELEPMTHELAHHIDKLMMQALGEKWKIDSAPAAARQALVNELRALDYDQGKRRIKEGFAEFMRYYLTTDQAAAKAPEFHKFFTGTFLAKHKDLAANLAGLKKRLEIWQKQGSENRIIEQIDFKGEHTNIATAGDKIRKARDWILKNFSDEFYTIKKIEDQMGIKPGVNIEPAKDPFTMATYAKAKASAIARTFVLEKAVDETGKVLGPGLQDILKPVKPEEMKQFIAYGVAMRSAFLAERGIESGIDIDDVKFILDKYENKGWDPVIDGITKWSDHFLEWLIRSGGLGPAEAEAIRALNPIYLPFKRAFLKDLDVQKGVGKALVNKGSPVKAIKGSGRAIINPIESLVAQATEMILKAQKINVARLIADLAEKEGVGGFIARVPPPIQGTTFSLEQIKSSLDAMGIDLADADLDSILTVFTQGWQYRGKDNIVSVWRGGKREFYELHPDLYRALMGMDMLERGVVLKILSPFARLLRLGATGIKISFGLIRNPWRDALSYAVLSKNKLAIPGVDTIKGVAHELTAKPGDLAWRFKAMGGSLSGMMGYDRAATMSVYDDMVNAKIKLTGKVIKAVEPQNWFKTVAYMLDQLRGGLNITELGPRIAELESSYNRYRKEHPGWSEESCFIAAFNDAQDVTVNFTKSGYLGKRINEFAAFFNANVQGPEKMFRSAKSNPVAFLLKGIVWLTIPIIMNWMRNKDKDWYNNLPPTYRYGNIFIEIDDNNILRLPIPFEVGAIFLSAPAAALDSLKHKDPKFIQSVVGIITKQFPSIVPSAFQPTFEVWRNKTVFDNPIETKEMEYMPRQERKKYYTSAFAVELSKALKGMKIDVLSPVQIDYLIQQHTGGFTRQFPHGNILTAADAPVLSDILVKSPEKPARQMNEFYTDWETLTYKYRTKTLEKGELTQYQRLKVVNKYMEIYFDSLKKYNQKKDLEGIKKTYRRIEDALAKVGY